MLKNDVVEHHQNKWLHISIYPPNDLNKKMHVQHKRV
jgi:hypothetical protein